MKTILTTLNAHSVTRMTGVLQAASLRDSIDFAKSASGNRRAFTLIELLVVIVIIGILASIGLPAMKGIGKTNVTAGAYRQLLDDLAFARLKAINERSTVYMVFVPTNIAQRLVAPGDPLDTRVLTNLVTGQYTTYALVTDRTVGDQPGKPTKRYLTSWKSLPDGIIFPPYLFEGSYTNSLDERTRSLPLTDRIPFPNSTSLTFPVPYIAFNAFGQLVQPQGFQGQDRLLAFGRGSVIFTRDNVGNLVSPVPDVQMIPPTQDTNNLQYVRIDAITGRAKAEIPEFK